MSATAYPLQWPAGWPRTRHRERYWLANIYAGIASRDKWTGGVIDQSRLAFGLCQATEEGAQQQLAALRAVCLGGVE